MPRIAVGEHHLFYLDAPEPTDAYPPIVLCAGLGYGAWFWHRLVPRLRPRRALAFDNRGAGGSDKPAGPYLVEQLGADVIGLLDALQLAFVDLVGHSLGGYVAQEVAARHPRRVRRLALLGTTSGGPRAIPPEPGALAVMLERSGDPASLFLRGLTMSTAPGLLERDPDLIAALRAYRAQEPVPAPAYQAQVAAGVAFATQGAAQVAERLGAIRAPTLVLAGEHDQVTPPGNAALLAAGIAGARAQVLRGVGHLFPLEDAEATAQALRAFFAEGQDG